MSGIPPLRHAPTRRVLLGAAASSLAVPRLARADAVTRDTIRRAGKLRIGVGATYPPFTMRESGVITGHDMELGTLVCRSLAVVPEFVDVVWSGVIPALYAGRFDMIMIGMSYTRARMERVAFSIPYAEAGQALLIRGRDAGAIKIIEDMAGKTAPSAKRPWPRRRGWCGASTAAPMPAPGCNSRPMRRIPAPPPSCGPSARPRAASACRCRPIWRRARLRSPASASGTTSLPPNCWPMWGCSTAASSPPIAFI